MKVSISHKNNFKGVSYQAQALLMSKSVFAKSPYAKLCKSFGFEGEGKFFLQEQALLLVIKTNSHS